MIVVDTSVLVDFLRGRTTPATDRLAELEADEIPYAIPLICFQEVLQGARDEREWRTLDAFIGTQRLLEPPSPAQHREAARIFFDCRRRGFTVRSSVDCLIAAQVLAEKNTLLHDDADFDHVGRVRPLRATRG